MEQQPKIPLKIDLFPENLETLNNDIKRVSDALEKACKMGVFSLKESQLLCTSVENFAQLVLLLSQSAHQTLEKVKELDKKIEQMKKEQILPKQNKIAIVENDPNDVPDVNMRNIHNSQIMRPINKDVNLDSLDKDVIMRDIHKEYKSRTSN